MSNYVAGLDLAQSSDYSALVIANHLQQDDGEKESPLIDVYHVQHVQRWRGVPYPALVHEVCSILATPPLRGRIGLTIDATGVGRAVMDLFWKAHQDGNLDPPAWGLTITAGQEAAAGHVPKKDLVAKLVVLFEQGRLKIAADVPLAKELQAELQEFRSRINASAHVSFDAPVGKHDDLVIALALCTYFRRMVNEPDRIDPRGEIHRRDVDAWATA